MEEIRIFTHPIFGEIRVTGTNDDPYFLLGRYMQVFGTNAKNCKPKTFKGGSFKIPPL